jgi:acetyl-CoA carboxylase biotin carboxyl carrier protein
MAKIEIRAPLPGTFFRRTAPGQRNYKDVGEEVRKGDVIGLIEVMKTFNEIKSDVSGVVTAFVVDNEDPVMAGQPLVEIET